MLVMFGDHIFDILRCTIIKKQSIQQKIEYIQRRKTNNKEMILDSLHRLETKQSLMTNHRLNYNKFKAFITERKFDLLNIKEVNKEKDLVIEHLNNCQNDDMIDQFQELSFYQERYLVLYKFLVARADKNGNVDPQEVDKVVHIFEEKFQIQEQQKLKPATKINLNLYQKPSISSSINKNSTNLNNYINNNPTRNMLNANTNQSPGNTNSNPFSTINAIKKTPSLLIDQQQKPGTPLTPGFPASVQKSPTGSVSSNTGLGAAIFQFFENKQRQSKTVGFKDLIEKRSNVSGSSGSSGSKVFAKKIKRPNHDLEVKKLLEENKRLHIVLEKRSKEDMELNEFEKNVLRQQKQRCLKRIQQLQDEVEQLARNNYKLQQIQRSQRQIPTFTNDSSINSQPNQYNPYYIKPRPNNLQVITQNNKIAKLNNVNMNMNMNVNSNININNINKDKSKQQILLQMVEEIPPIQKKQQYSFDEEHGGGSAGYGGYRNDYGQDNILGLLDRFEDKPEFGRRDRTIFSTGKNNNNLPFNTGQQALYTPPNIQNNSINTTSFQSFSIAQTAYNNSSLFMNASKNQINIDGSTSTRNKVAFFKNSLILYRDDEYEIAYKRSNLNQTFSQIRIIFYVHNKGNFNQIVNIQYDYQTVYYQFKINQKLRNVGPKQQAREVVEISLHPKCADLNSVIDMHFQVGHRKFDLWVPVSFIAWGKDSLIEGSRDVGFMTVQPDRQFCSYENMLKIVPLTSKMSTANDEVQAYMFGRSRFGNHEIKLTWYQKQLTIDANTKILDFLGFIMHHFK